MLSDTTHYVPWDADLNDASSGWFRIMDFVHLDMFLCRIVMRIYDG